MHGSITIPKHIFTIRLTTGIECDMWLEEGTATPVGEATSGRIMELYVTETLPKLYYNHRNGLLLFVLLLINFWESYLSAISIDLFYFFKIFYF